MEYVKWMPEKYSVNIRRIDEQHQKLVAIINEVYATKSNNAGKSAIYQILSQMNDYTKTHFKDEEKLMQEYGFPNLDKHQTYHQYFIDKIHEFIGAYKQHDELILEEILPFLRDWLLNHIMETDKIYAVFLNGKGIY